MFVYYTYQILHDFLNPSLCPLHTVFGTLDDHLVTFDPTSREADGNPTKFITNVFQDLTTASNKVSVVLGIYMHLTLHNIVLYEKK